MVACGAVALATAAPAGGVGGGRRADIARMPFVAKVGGCTGTLIAPDRVLTAAHCVDGVTPEVMPVVVGADPARDRTAPRLAVRGFAVAPGFKVTYAFERKGPNSGNAVNDVALVVLAAPVTNIAPVRLAGPGDAALQRSGRAAKLVGYGQTRPPSVSRPPGSVALNEGAVQLLSRARCARSYNPRVVSRAMVCSVDPDGGRPFTQACPGDSGGPLLVRGPDGPVQIGVTSWGGEAKHAPCGARGFPSVAMRVAAYHAFLTQPDPTLAPFPTGPATIAGDPRPGGTLTCAAAFGGSPARLAYRWVTTRFRGQLYDDNAAGLIEPIAGATGSALPVTPALAARRSKVACEIRASNRGGHFRIFTRNVQLGALT